MRSKEQIDQENQEFVVMEPAQQRVQIAKDVLKYLGKGVLDASEGDYFMIKGYEEGKDLRDLIEEAPESQKCTVCALGAAFYCAVLRVDNYKLSKIDNSSYVPNEVLMFGSNVKNFLRAYFEEDQLELIESAFEREKMGDEDAAKDEDMKTAIDFGKGYYYENKRLVAIMNNIVENEGKFKP